MGNETLAQRGFTRCKAPLLMKATVLSHLSRQCLLCSCESSEVKDRLRRFIGEVPRLCAIWMPHCGRKGKCCVYSLAKISIFFRRNRLFLQQKVRAFQIQSSVVENLRAFFPFFPCFYAEPPLFERPPPPFRSVPLPSFPICSPASPTRPARSRV